MDFKLGFGQSYNALELRENTISAVISPNFPRVQDARSLVEAALHNPIASPTLRQLVEVKRPGRVAIIVNDNTRPTPYDYLLPALLRELNHAGVSNSAVTMVVATGAHQVDPKATELKFLGTAAENCSVVFHDCTSRDLATAGILSNGVVFRISP